jgi:membrane-bound metal-dependent hydrolase YbcI (DUF457 family)
MSIAPAESAIIWRPVPSPIGHILAGATIAWASDSGAHARTLSPIPGARARLRNLTLVCAALAAAADLDLVLPGTHRTVTHSMTAVAVVAIVAIAMTGKVISSPGGWRVVLACTAAYASHLLLDWLGADPTPPYGLQLLWPFSDRWFISNLDLFRGTARIRLFTAASIRTNALAILQEVAILGPIALAAWLVRVKAAAGLATQLAGRHQAPE